MPVVQSTYGANMAAGVPGQPATMNNWDADSKIVETDAGIGFGLAVSQGTNARQILLGGASGFVGITYRDITLMHAASADVDKYLDKELAGVMVKGDIWVVSEDAVAVGDPVEYNATTGQLGSDGGVRIPNARWMTAAGAGGLAIVRLVTASATDAVV